VPGSGSELERNQELRTVVALAIAALILLFRRCGRAPLVAIVAALLYCPAAIVGQSGHFSAVKPPAAIQAVELVQVVVAAIVLA